jgi:hypothetical protein
MDSAFGIMQFLPIQRDLARMDMVVLWISTARQWVDIPKPFPWGIA